MEGALDPKLDQAVRQWLQYDRDLDAILQKGAPVDRTRPGPFQTLQTASLCL